MHLFGYKNRCGNSGDEMMKTKPTTDLNHWKMEKSSEATSTPWAVLADWCF